MYFTEFRFFIFFLIVFAVHWLLQSNFIRKIWLLVCSHFFYACFFIGDPIKFWEAVSTHQWAHLKEGWWFPFVLMGSTCMDYAVGLGIEASAAEWKRRAWLFISLAINLGVLCFFKYFDFFAGSASEFLRWLHLPVGDWTLKVFLPYGISFYTFQSMSYSIDVYRRRLKAVRSFLDLAFFIAFFPQLVAGPIVRAITFLPQVFEKRIWNNVDVRGCLTLFFIGFVKKRCISENVAPIVDEFFQNAWKYNVTSTWIAVLFYSVQIYCDFSGYTDMAIASARLLGYELTPNFNFPYFSRDVTEFWRRWHISLSTWLRDYLYISLGGNRGSKLSTYRNLMVTMVLGGLWHGASWTFIIWGALHGGALIIHREWQRFTENASSRFKRISGWLSVPLTYYWVCIAWIFFRANDVMEERGHKMVMVKSAMQVAKETAASFIFFRNHEKKALNPLCLVFFATLALVHWLCSRGTFSNWWRRIPDWAYAALLGAGTAVALYFVPTNYRPFIYLKF